MLKPSAQTTNFINGDFLKKEDTWRFVASILSSNFGNHTAEFRLNMP